MGAQEIRTTNWRANGDIKKLHRGIDLHVEFESGSLLYETQCFTALHRCLVDTEFAIGPHLVDAAFGRSFEWQGFVRPDMMIFKEYDGIWQLTSMAEFKTSKRTHVQYKLHGFSTLLIKLRENPSFLSAQLRTMLGAHMQIPSDLRVPEDDQIEVYIVSPYRKPHMYNTRTDFKFHYFQFEAQ